MNNEFGKPLRKTLALVAAGTMALGLAACDREMSAEKMGQSMDRNADKTGEQISRSADKAEQKMADAKSAVTEKAAAAGEAMGDAAITAKVKSALIAEPKLQSTGIDVVTEKGVVRLFGTTASDANRERATRLTAAVEGVKAVENNLAIVQGS